jgi:hypothetical protein
LTTTASIYFNQIRENYPQSGKDNDSQGFRDNFRNIKYAFSATNANIVDLQASAVTLAGSNDFGYNVIKKATFQGCATNINDETTNPRIGNIAVNFLSGSYQKFSINTGTTTFSINNWPASNLGELTVAVSPTTTSTATIAFGGTVVAIGNVTLPVDSNDTDTKFFDLWSDDGGVTTYISQRGV